jgi:hypothetical protein
MVIDTGHIVAMQIISNVLLFIMGAIAFYCVILSLPKRKRRWRPSRRTLFTSQYQVPAFMLKLLMIKPGKGMEERKQLLIGSGITLGPSVYEAIRRLLTICLLIVACLSYLAFSHPSLVLYMNPVYLLAGSAIVLLLALMDKKLLEQVKVRRSHRIVKEIYVISHQLLYYSGSHMNLHAKLIRCLPQMRMLRPYVQLLLNEWYQDGAGAIRSFKQRLGTDEAHSFAETLNALQFHENESYYELLRQRIQDYKEKIELTRESRKETVSYVLFVLAGLPIMNTFRVFMYPWIVEGQQLFNAIN